MGNERSSQSDSEALSEQAVSPEAHPANYLEVN